MEDNKKCPICGSIDIGKGKTYSPNLLHPTKGVLKFGSEIEADICTDCGHILAMRVMQPERFKK